MDGVSGTVKDMVFKKVKSGMALINSPRDFVDTANKLLVTISTGYLPKNDEMEEPEGTTNTNAINSTLLIYIPKRKTSDGVVGIDFYTFASDESPSHTQWYPIESGVM